MTGVLAVLFLLVPIAELAVIVTVAGQVGVIETLGLLVLVSVAGAWLVKREGLGVMRRLSETIGRGEIPHRELVDGFLVLLAGVFFLTPGFLTDLVAILLLLPPVRAAVRAPVTGALRRRVPLGFGRGHGRPGTGQAYDVDGRDATARRPDRPGLGK
ncbi:MAG: FxsA family protein [Acidimicrobiia bacterium]